MKLGQGTLIAFEGVDGSGKSTLIKYLVEHLITENVSTETVSYADQHWFRNAYANQPSYADAPREIEFFSWAFNQLVDQCVNPLLREGKVVLVDRYLLSYLAYQTFHGIASEVLLSKVRTDAPTPSLIVILDVPLEIALKRCRERKSSREDFYSIPFSLTAVPRLEHAAAYYKNYADSGGLMVDGEQPIEEVSERIWGAVKSLLDLA